MGRPVYVSKTLAAASANNIALSQTLAGAASVTLNGSTATAGVATLDTQRQIIITSGGNDSGITFLISGTDQTGNPVSETLAGANVGVATSTKNYLKILSITSSGATASTITVGTNGIGATQWILCNYHGQPVNVSISVQVTGTVNYTGQFTNDDFMLPTSPAPFAWNDPSMTAMTGSVASALNDPFVGYRVVINSGNGTIKLTFIDNGIKG